MEADLEYIRQLYLLKLTGTLTEEEEKELEAAMEDPHVKKMCKELDELYQSPEMLELLKTRPTSQRWNELAERIMEKSGEPMRYLRTFRWLAAASVVALIGFATYLFLQPSRKPGHELAGAGGEGAISRYDIRLRMASGEKLALKPDYTTLVNNVMLETEGNTLRFQQRADGGGQMNTLEVPARRDYQVILADGTEVWLNAASTMKFPFSFDGSSQRVVEIQGEAYFNVARNAEKPFIVRTANGDIQVLGTAFNVNTYEPGRVTASLVRGSIKAISSATATVLQPGQAGVWSRDAGQIEVSRFEQTAVLGWMQGVYYFEGADLEEIAKTIRRLYDVEVLIDNPSLTNYRFAIKVDKNKPLEDFLEAIQITKGVKHRLAGNTLHLF